MTDDELRELIRVIEAREPVTPHLHDDVPFGTVLSMAKELLEVRWKAEHLRRALADADEHRCGGTKLLRPKEFKNPAPEYEVGIECSGCKDCRT